MVAITSTNGSPDECNPLFLAQGGQEENSLSKKPSRKQWSVQGEPRALLKRLRSHLAEDGCPESQYLMAKALLDHSTDLNYEENCHQAIFWLTQASLQGSLDATTLLKECLEKGLGICEQNYQDVRRCLEMDHQEKLALVAGKQLFSSVSEGSEFVTQRKLETRIAEIINDKKEDIECEEKIISSMSKLEMKCYLEQKYGSKRLSEALLVEGALEFVKGEVPPIRLKESNVFKDKISPQNFTNLHIFMLEVIESSLLPKFTLLKGCSRSSHLLMFTLISALLYWFRWSQLAVIALACLWLASFFLMSHCAVAIMTRRRDKGAFDLWARVFQHFSQELNLDGAAVKYKSKFKLFYLTYFGSMLTYLVLLPVVNTSVKAFVLPPLLLISCCMLTSLFQSNFSYNCLSSFLYVFAHYSEGQKCFKHWVIQSLPSIEPYIMQESLSIYDTLYLNLDVGSIFHSLWFVSLVFVSLTLGASGILVHMMCVTWFHMALAASCHTFGAWIYVSVAVWFLICFLPQGLHLLTATIPAFLFALCCFVSGLGMWITALVFLFSSIFLCMVSHLDSKLSSILKCVFFLLSVIFLFQEHSETSSRISSLQWDQFQNICIPTKETMGVAAVRSCRPFKGTVVQWQATVREVEVASVWNLPLALASFLPAVLQPPLKCALGLPPVPCGDEALDPSCLLLREAKGEECSLTHWDEYQFHLVVSMESHFWKFSKSADVVLVAGDEMRDVAFNLSASDRISFVGTLLDGLGTSALRIRLTSVDCLDCRAKPMAASNRLQFSIDYDQLYESLKSTFNFVFGPTITV